MCVNILCVPLRPKKMESKTKCKRMIAEEYGRKDYFSKMMPGEVRDYFSTRVMMLPLAGNYSKDNRLRRTGWLCLCGDREEQEHIRLHCKKYDDIRVKYTDLLSDDNLVQFFREVLDRRDMVREEEEKEEEKRRKSGGGEEGGEEY